MASVTPERELKRLSEQHVNLKKSREKIGGWAGIVTAKKISLIAGVIRIPQKSN